MYRREAHRGGVGGGVYWRPRLYQTAVSAPAKRAKTSVCPFQTLQGAKVKGADQESGLTDQAKGAMAAREKRKDAKVKG